MHVLHRRKNQQIVIHVGSELIVVRVLYSQFNKASLGLIAREGVFAYTEEKARHVGLEENLVRLLDEDRECNTYTMEEPFFPPSCVGGSP